MAQRYGDRGTKTSAEGRGNILPANPGAEAAPRIGRNQVFRWGVSARRSCQSPECGKAREFEHSYKLFETAMVPMSWRKAAVRRPSRLSASVALRLR